MSLRRSASGLVAALAVLLLAGCSEPVTGATGIKVENGQVLAVVQMCPDVSASEVYLGNAARSDMSWDGGTWQFISANYATVDLGTVEEFLELVGDREVQLSSNSSGGAGGWVKFDALDIGELRKGEILSFSWSADEDRLFDVVSFENEALAICPIR